MARTDDGDDAAERQPPWERHVRLAEWRRTLVAAGGRRLSERLPLLGAFGFANTDLALLVDRADLEADRASAAFAELWALVGFLVADGTYDEEDIVLWLSSPRGELAGRRPIDLLAEGGELAAVWSAAEQHLLAAGLDRGDFIELPPVRAAGRGRA